MLTVNASRLLNDVHALAKIGETPQGGVSRLAFSENDIAGRSWFVQKIHDAGLQLRQDGAGNISAILPTSGDDRRTVMAGSHLDSVTNGGRFDGSIGVLAALEALRTLKENHVALPVNLEAISFTDEEGTILGEFGSLALSGALTADMLRAPRGGVTALKRGMQRLGLTPQSVLGAKRSADDLLAFVELHIEQGTRLEEANIPIGIVTSIVGIRSFWLTFNGQAAHAGTMPMKYRKDAMWGASAYIQAARRMIVERFSPGVVNFGNLHVKPGGFNIVPSHAQLALEFRHASEGQLDDMETHLLDLARQTAEKFKLNLEIKPLAANRAAPSSIWVVDTIERAAKELGYANDRMISFAGHDAQAMSKITPSAMIFVPSVNGISHDATELTHDDDIVAGANTLLQTMMKIARSVEIPDRPLRQTGGLRRKRNNDF